MNILRCYQVFPGILGCPRKVCCSTGHVYGVKGKKREMNKEDMEIKVREKGKEKILERGERGE